MNNLKNKNVAIYGGSFNPFHIGHLLTAYNILDSLHYDIILFVPANIPVHKDFYDSAGSENRFKMIKLSIENQNCFMTSDIEIIRGGKSYTVDTVKELKAKYDLNQKIGIIFGDDLLHDLSAWKDISYLQNYCELICLTRNLSVKKKSKFKIKYLNNKIIDTSSTEIRKRIKMKKPIDFMVLPAVNDFILKNKLYEE